MKEEVENKKSYLKIFLIPTFLFIIIMYFACDNIKEFCGFIPEMFVLIIMWFIICFPITFIYLKLRNLKIIKMFINNFLYLCLIINFIIFIYFRSLLIIENILKSIVFTILSFIPTLVSLLLILMKRKKILKNSIINCIQVLFLLFFSIYFFTLIIIGNFILAVDGVNNIKNYEKVCSMYKAGNCPDIPVNAKNITFHYNAPLLQGGEVFYLYFKSDYKTIKKYQKKYEKMSKWVKEYNSIDNNYSYLKNDNIDDLFTNSMKNVKIYYLDGRCDDSGYCNHGEYNAVLIDEFSNSIMFKSERW